MHIYNYADVVFVSRYDLLLVSHVKKHKASVVGNGRRGKKTTCIMALGRWNRGLEESDNERDSRARVRKQKYAASAKPKQKQGNAKDEFYSSLCNDNTLVFRSLA